MGALGELLRQLYQLLPTWAFVLLVAAIALPVVRGWRFRTRSRRISELVRRMVRADAAGRADLTAEAFACAGEDPFLLAWLVTEARRRHMTALAADALARLETVPGGRREAARLADAPPAPPLHPLEVVVRVEQMLEEGLVEAARLRLDEALARHPDHPELSALRRRLSDEAHGP